MTRLIGMITGNPLVLLWLVLGSIAFGVATGGSAAWYVQGLRVTSAKQDLVTYQQKQTQILQEAKDVADKDRIESSKNYAAARAELERAYDAGEVYRRCVAAGRCGVRTVRVCGQSADSAGISLPPGTGVDGAGTDAVPATARASDEVIDPLIKDCMKTTLELNHLQMDIKKQPGY